MKLPDWLSREQRRLRRKFIKKLATRDYHTVDRWLDTEYLKAGIPAWIGIFLFMVHRSPDSHWLLVGGLSISGPWWTFITVIILQVYGRWGDKVYMRITRRKLSREYRR